MTSAERRLCPVCKNPDGFCVAGHDCHAVLDQELEAARARIADLEKYLEQAQFREIELREQLCAQGLSQQLNFYPYVRHLEACSTPSCYRHHANKDVGKRNCSCGLDAAILRRLGAQTT